MSWMNTITVTNTFKDRVETVIEVPVYSVAQFSIDGERTWADLFVINNAFEARRAAKLVRCQEPLTFAVTRYRIVAPDKTTVVMEGSR